MLPEVHFFSTVNQGAADIYLLCIDMVMVTMVKFNRHVLSFHLINGPKNLGTDVEVRQR